jgi:hypothetical protein
MPGFGAKARAAAGGGPHGQSFPFRFSRAGFDPQGASPSVRIRREHAGKRTTLGECGPVRLSHARPTLLGAKRIDACLKSTLPRCLGSGFGEWRQQVVDDAAGVGLDLDGVPVMPGVSGMVCAFGVDRCFIRRDRDWEDEAFWLTRDGCERA